MDNIIKFEKGVTYYARSLCDHNCIYQSKVVKRTEKTVWILDPKSPKDKVISKKIHIRDGVEGFYPHGRHSMAAYMDATKVYDPEKIYPDWEKPKKDTSQPKIEEIKRISEWIAQGSMMGTGYYCLESQVLKETEKAMCLKSRKLINGNMVDAFCWIPKKWLIQVENDKFQNTRPGDSFFLIREKHYTLKKDEGYYI